MSNFQSLEIFVAQTSRHWKKIFFAAIAVIAALGAAAQPAYKIADLGTLGGKTSRARAIGDDGAVAGEAETKGGELHAFFWTAKDGMKDLGTPGGRFSRAHGINDRGVVVGEGEIFSGVSVAFRWSSDAGMTNLARPAGVDSAYASAINHFGVIVGAGETESGSRALRWEMNAVAEIVTNGAAFSAARAVNEAGLMAGQMAASPSDQFSSVAFVRGGESNAALKIFSSPKFSGSSSAQAVNGGGVAAGFAEIAAGRIHAMRFGADGVTDLDTMNNAYSSANGINDSNDVVGVFFNGAGDDDRPKRSHPLPISTTATTAIVATRRMTFWRCAAFWAAARFASR